MMRLIKTHCHGKATPRALALQAQPRHPALCIVVTDPVATDTASVGPTVRALYYGKRGKSPLLLIDLSHKDVAPIPWSIAKACCTFGIALPANSQATPLDNKHPIAVYAQSLRSAADPEQDADLCTTDICMKDADPAYGCEACGAEFCSETCRYRAAHICVFPANGGENAELSAEMDVGDDEDE